MLVSQFDLASAKQVNRKKTSGNEETSNKVCVERGTFTMVYNLWGGGYSIFFSFSDVMEDRLDCSKVSDSRRSTDRLLPFDRI